MRDNILRLLYSGTTTLYEFQWDTMRTAPLLSLITQGEIDQLNKIILSPKYSGNNNLKTKKIDEIMNFRGFKRFAGGTNRLVYEHDSAPNAVFKIAIDMVGINDNPAEYKNQQYLKPYCTKVFECSPCGTIASFEKVERITSYEEFYSIAEDYFYIISSMIIGKYVMDDIGADYFMNVGIRKGCHPVILDFPYMFELDGKKLECHTVLNDGTVCRGDIDYDEGFNKLVCKKCGTVFRARDLAKHVRSWTFSEDGGSIMKVQLMKGDKVIKTINDGGSVTHVNKRNVGRVRNNDIVVNIIRNNNISETSTEEKKIESSAKTSTDTQRVNTKLVTVVLNDSKDPIKATVEPYTENKIRFAECDTGDIKVSKVAVSDTEEEKEEETTPVEETAATTTSDEDDSKEDEKDKEESVSIIVEDNENENMVDAISFVEEEEIKTPYEIAVENGFSGTEEEFLTSIGKDKEKDDKKKIDQKLIEKRTIKFTDKKPEDKEFESDYVYLVKKEDSDIDIEVYDDNVSDFSFIDLTLFDVFVRIDDEEDDSKYKIYTIYYDDGEWFVKEESDYIIKGKEEEEKEVKIEEEVDEDLEFLKKSSRRLSLDD